MVSIFIDDIKEAFIEKNIEVKTRGYRGLLHKSFYYPASGLDFKIIDRFKYACSSFIFSDYTFTDEGLEAALKEQNFLKNYEIVFMKKFSAEQFPEYEYVFGRTKDYLAKLEYSEPSYSYDTEQDTQDLIITKSEFEKSDYPKDRSVNLCMQRNVFYNIVFMRKGASSAFDIGKRNSDFINVILLSTDSVCAYEGIYNRNNAHPTYMLMKKCGTGLSGGYTNLVAKGGIFEKIVLKNNNHPRYLAFSQWGGFGDGKEYETCFEPNYKTLIRSFDYRDNGDNNHINIWQGRFDSQSDTIIDYSDLEKIKGTTLYYPCSGMDFIPPILLFAPIIDNFWFVDINYFASENHEEYELNKDARKWGDVLKGFSEFEFIKSQIEGKPNWDLSNRDIDPCILTLTYYHKPTNREIHLHFRRGYGVSGFYKEALDPLGIFYYRGDSEGEGGSGNIWFSNHNNKHRFDAVTSRLVDGGLIVTDGSNPGHDLNFFRNVEFMWQYSRSRGYLDIQKILSEHTTFIDSFKNVFKRIGYAGIRYGPTFIWQKNVNQDEWDY